MTYDLIAHDVMSYDVITYDVMVYDLITWDIMMRKSNVKSQKIMQVHSSKITMKITSK